MIAALKFWLIPAIASGVLPWLMELKREKKLPHRKIRPLWYYLGALIQGPVVVALAIAATRGGDSTFPLVAGATIVLATVWIGAFSRPHSFDPYLGAWCVVNGICATFTVANRDWGDLAWLSHLMVWFFIGLPLAMVALVVAAILNQLPTVIAPEIPRSDSAHQASGE
ncbi:hypothetical protein [Corynebacterium sp. H130]|uniref:hypothetical protein n=1 Tax=Corynebacterium sp. H130 TaxID=3133444 RepID=UPI00309A9A1A